MTLSVVDEEIVTTPPLPMLEGEPKPPAAEPRRPWHIQLAVILLFSVGVLTGVFSLLSGVMVIVGLFALRDAVHGGNGRADQVALWVVLPCVAALLLAALTYGIGVWNNRLWRIPGKEPSDEEE